MIANVPTQEDFKNHALLFLNFAWNYIMDMRSEIDASIYNGSITEDEANKYWNTATKQLTISLALAQQGAELALKSAITMVSPFLLVVDPPSKWKYKDKLQYAKLKLVDSSELIKTYDVALDNQLNESFKSKYEKFRQLRNRVFHTVDKELKCSFNDVLVYILEINSILTNKIWFNVRKHFLETVPFYKVNDFLPVTDQLSYELETLLREINNKYIKLYLGINKRQRRYMCLDCMTRYARKSGEYIKPAYLKPNTPQSTNIYCMFCDKNITVIREKCRYGCKGNVIDSSQNTCLSCYS